jgi:hypothetical protein
VCLTGKNVNSLLETPLGNRSGFTTDHGEHRRSQRIGPEEVHRASGVQQAAVLLWRQKRSLRQDDDDSRFRVAGDQGQQQKIEVITTVSKPGTDLSMKITEISNKFKRAFSNQHSQVAKMIARLEKIEAKSSSFNFPNDSIPQLDSQGVLQTSLSAASGTSIETPVYEGI